MLQRIGVFLRSAAAKISLVHDSQALLVTSFTTGRSAFQPSCGKMPLGLVMNFLALLGPVAVLAWGWSWCRKRGKQKSKEGDYPRSQKWLQTQQSLDAQDTFFLGKVSGTKQNILSASLLERGRETCALLPAANFLGELGGGGVWIRRNEQNRPETFLLRKLSIT